MHLLAAEPGRIADGDGAVDLGQSPGEIVVLSAADSELALLAAARERCGSDFPRLRLASLLALGHPASVDLYIDNVLRHARLVIVRLLGGRGYWPYGVERLAELAARENVALGILPGDDQPDAELASFGTLAPEAQHRLWQFLVHGGIDNAQHFLSYAAHLIGREAEWREPRPMVRAGFYVPGVADADLAAVRAGWQEGRPRAALVFYRALVQAGNLKAVDALIAALAAEGMNVLPVFVAGLKDPVAAATLEQAFAEAVPDVILNATAFAAGTVGSGAPFAGIDCPVLQVIFSGGSEAGWREGTRGLAARDIAMNVALPEIDGRILSRAVSFKGRARRDPATECDVVEYAPVPDRVAFVAKLAARWAKLRRTPAAERRIAIVLANYPNRDGRLANGVGLDTPASAIVVLKGLKAAGYAVEGAPTDGAELIDRLLEGPTNANPNRPADETLAMPDYQAFFGALPAAVRDKVTARWGAAETDPFFRPGRLDCGRFAIPALRLGRIAVAVQPARGYNIDPEGSYHDPALPPPHNYLAFYAWAQDDFRADAIVHLGKHGNLEWLPGKALALSNECFPEAALGPLPHLYPFIVNDPGEGTQAKRRAQAVIVDHLTPPLARAGTYGPLAALERLIDEYYLAAQTDPRRLESLGTEILSLCRVGGLDADCGIAPDEGEASALKKLDSHLCAIKESQIRDGLHVFGASPEGSLLSALLVALARVPRGKGEGRDASILRALSMDLGLDFDPLACDLAAPWIGAKPAALDTPLPNPPPQGGREVTKEIPSPLMGEGRGGGELHATEFGPWRTVGDTVERLEALALALVEGTRAADPAWRATRAVLDWIESTLKPAVVGSGPAELAGLLAGLAGRFVAPGPSGAPTRGRPDVLPTGRNFYSVDTRAVPTPAAWTLGWKSAALLLERHMQDHGQWPKALAVSAWGTANMRTGGDDIAQALALLGVRPTWEIASGRVTGFEVMPLSVLARPRIDVTLRVSGFFRDAFPGLIDLFDSATRAIAALDEPAEENPLAERVREDARALEAKGASPADALHRAGFRVFGSKPGAYGAGLQALIDEKGWQSDADLARAYVAWGGFAYGAGREGEAAHALFETRLGRVEAVVHNQDNREHDLLDSDDYYQFEGGLTAAVRNLSGAAPAVYHNDHSRPETPAVRTLAEEIARVVRARVVNPKWIAGVMRHGYKGAFEMAATVDYLFAFAATARCVGDHHFDLVFQAYLDDVEVRTFLENANPAALKEIAERLLEAQARGLWRPRLNSTRPLLERLAA